jgi:hypothetical protein
MKGECASGRKSTPTQRSSSLRRFTPLWEAVTPRSRRVAQAAGALIDPGRPPFACESAGGVRLPCRWRRAGAFPRCGPRRAFVLARASEAGVRSDRVWSASGGLALVPVAWKSWLLACNSTSVGSTGGAGVSAALAELVRSGSTRPDDWFGGRVELSRSSRTVTSTSASATSGRMHPRRPERL